MRRKSERRNRQGAKGKIQLLDKKDVQEACVVNLRLPQLTTQLVDRPSEHPTKPFVLVDTSKKLRTK